MKKINARYIRENIITAKSLIAVSLSSWIIGGLIQAFHLIGIGLFYLNFFSISQIPNDTITIIFPIIIFLFIIWFVYKLLIEKIFEKRDVSESFFNVLIIGITFSPILLFGNTFFYYSYFILTRIIIICLTGLLVLSVNETEKIDYGSETLNFIRQPISTIILELIIYMILLFILALCLSHVLRFKEMPDNFLNIKSISCISSNSCKILYFNDQFIFTEDHYGKINIYKYDTIFKE